MAQDPYGFQDSAPAKLGGGFGTDSDASRAMWLGLVAALLGSVGVCFCYVPYVVALPMAIYAAFLGNRALQSARDDNTRSMATSGLVGGILGSLVSGMFTMFFVIYALIMVAYFGIIVVAIAAGAADAAG